MTIFKPSIAKFALAAGLLLIGMAPVQTFVGFGQSHVIARGLPFAFAEYKGQGAHLYLTGLIFDWDLVYPILFLDFILLYALSCLLLSLSVPKLITKVRKSNE